MKKHALIVCALFVTALLAASVTPALAVGKSHDVKGEVVSINLEGKTLTFKDEKGESKTVPVIDKAVDSLKTLKAGDKVTMTCMDSETGEHQAVSAIKLDKK
ncbi:MAG TPA: hypothetical protein VGR38_04680 [Candidatus Polarisedimenticolia bacterium]|jgi:hypothetical protein|nr:hypothetical protein [Candidatus Polarisedimenticolia bacterium]